jgi:hypothetical protein
MAWMVAPGFNLLIVAAAILDIMKTVRSSEGRRRHELARVPVERRRNNESAICRFTTRIRMTISLRPPGD